MKTLLLHIVLLAAAIAGLPAGAAAQGSEVVRIGQGYTLGAGDTAREVVVIFGNASIAGRVTGDVVVVFGAVQLSSTAAIDGDLVVVGGSGVVTSGAQVYGDLVMVGGSYDAPADFMPGGEQVVIGRGVFGGRLDAIVPWITRGLLWGRPIVPELGWIWGVVAFVFLFSLALNLVFDRPVRACADTLVERPLSAFAVGLLVLLLAGPVCLLLAVSVVGLAVVPFVFCAFLLAWVVGKVGVARRIGMTFVPQPSPDSRMQAAVCFILGFAVIVIAYMVPVLGFATWAMGGVFGLGAVTLAVIAGYRAENPHQAPLVPPVAMPAAHYQENRAMVPEAAESAYTPPVPPAAPPAAMSDLVSFPRAPFLDRLAALVLDVILAGFAAALLHGAQGGIFFLLLAYHIGFWTWKGTTVGGIICQLRVVRVDGTPLRFVDALVRGLSSIFSLAVLGLGCLWIIKDPERQSWHDKIAGTYVVKVPRNWPL